MTVFIDILSDDQSWAFALSLGNHSITVSEAGASGRGREAANVPAPTVRRECGFNAVEGGPDSHPAVFVPFHASLNTQGAK